MARPPRKHIAGAFYHITQRGNNQQRIFFSDEDRAQFCLLMQEGSERFDHRIHAFCLMDNHVHLLIQAGDKPLGKAMQNLTFRFAKRLNKQFKTTGHRFQGRYLSGLIDTDEYLHEVLKYIHLNPVKAKVVEEPGDYQWSSHNYYSHKENLPWVYRDYCLNNFGADRNRAIRRYQAFMSTPQNEEASVLIGASSFEYYIGDDEFIRRMESKYEHKIMLNDIDLTKLCDICCAEFDENSTDILRYGCTIKASFIRGVIGFILVNNTKYNLSDLARYCNKSQATISRSVKKISMRVADDTNLENKIDEIIERMGKLNANMHA